ncbi:MAG: HEAT repeat domain-containing protein [Actinobacteria bacterium]|jgi:HEAT repeat protein|nr:MAG: HEAT repeat domain-containing protein [Actinomycetota bacterium]
MPDEPVQRDSPADGQDLAAQSMTILSTLHAAMVNFHLYPPTSDIVEGSVQRALQELDSALASWGSITFCELEGKLLINEFSLDERDQTRPNTISFLKDLALWEVRSITFIRGLQEEELRFFLEVFSRKRSDRTLEGNLSSSLQEGTVEHISVDEKIYVSLSKDQEVSTGGGQDAGGDAMGLLRDEVFVRYLVGSAPSMEVSQEEVSNLMSDPERINAAFTSVMLGFEGKGGEVGPDKARLIRDTVDRMYSVVERLEDDELKETLSEQMIGILSALEPETLIEVLAESTPQVVKDPHMRKEIISSVEGENVLKLTDQIIEKYRKLIAERDGMSAQDYEDISSVLNEIVADLYTEGDPSFHPEITRRLRESGLLAELAQSHPQASREMQVYTIVTDIRTSGSLRSLEGLSDEEVIGVAGKLLDLGEKEITHKIIAVTSRNLESQRPDFRARACFFLKRMHLDFKERGHRAEILDKADELLDRLDMEQDPDVRAGLLELLGCVANDLFVEERMDAFTRVCGVLTDMAGPDGDERIRRAAAAALSSMNAWDVGRPLADSLYGEDEELRKLATRILPYIEESLTSKEIVDRLKGEEEIAITPQLAEVCSAIGNPVLSDISEVLESNAREEVYLRALRLLELMGGNAALSLVKSVEANPIPAVRAQATRSMAKIAPGDPSLLTHFLRGLEDGEPDVRREAVRGLGTIDDPRSVDALLVVVQGKSMSGGEENPRVEEAACFALARLSPEKAIAPLSDLLRKKVFTLRRRAVHPRTKAAACYALGQIGGPEVVELIRAYLDDSDPVVRNEARKAVGVLRKRGYVE